MKTQLQMMRDAEQRIFRLNEAVMGLINHPTNPMTNQDLERLIAQWPERYGRFSGFLGALKDEADT